MLRKSNGINKKRSVRKTSGKHFSRYGKHSARNIRGWVSELKIVSSVRNFRSVRNGNNNNKRGWVSERNDVSSVRNFRSVRNGNGIRGRVESGRGWARGRAEIPYVKLGVGVGSVRAYSCLQVGFCYEFSHHLKRFWCGPSVDHHSGALVLNNFCFHLALLHTHRVLQVRFYYEFSHHLKRFWCGPVGTADFVVMVIIIRAKEVM